MVEYICFWCALCFYDRSDSFIYAISGRALSVRHVRAGEFDRMIFQEHNYEYDNPKAVQ